MLGCRASGTVYLMDLFAQQELGEEDKVRKEARKHDEYRKDTRRSANREAWRGVAKRRWVTMSYLLGVLFVT